jgi:hypothetical protein
MIKIDLFVRPKFQVPCPTAKMTTPQIPKNSLIRTPQHTLIVMNEQGNLRALRDGDKTWSKKGVREEMNGWRDLDLFLMETQPAWWSIEFVHPPGWFMEASNLCFQRTKHLSWVSNSCEIESIRKEIFDPVNARFRDEILTPFITKYGLTRASDYSENELVYGTLSSPVARVAEEQLLEIEPDRTKWSIGVVQKKKGFMTLYRRYLNENYRKKFESPKNEVSPPASQPSQVIQTTQRFPSDTDSIKNTVKNTILETLREEDAIIMNRRTLSIILATGIRTIPDALWNYLKR